MANFVLKLGAWALRIYYSVQGFVAFVLQSLKALFSTRLKLRLTLAQMRTIGVESLPIIILTGTFTGLALALQTYVGFYRFGVNSFIGTIVALGMTRELGPVLTALMVTGRSGSAIAAELGTMQITEQIDALKTICINPYQYLIVPRIIASILVMPCLSLFSTACGIVGGYIFCSYGLDVSSEVYFIGVKKLLKFSDVLGGLIKASFFGLVIVMVGSYCGYKATGGARGVGKATTKSVVLASVLILIFDYFLTSILFQAGLDD